MNTFNLVGKSIFQKAYLSQVGLFLLGVFILLSPIWAFAQIQSNEIGPDTKRVANQVVNDIYQDILEAKLRYKDLVDFDSSALGENKYGFSVIEYSKRDFIDESQSFELGLTVVPIDIQNYFDTKYRTFHFTFPFLGVKIIAYQVNNGKIRQIDLAKLINKHGRLLLDLQQDYMPFRMKIISDKPTYEVGEKIGFTVRLSNHSDINLEVLKVSEETLYLNIDGAEWGSEDDLKDKNKYRTILQPGDYVEKHFEVEGSLHPRQIEIFGSYNVTFKGIKPSAVLSIPVVGSKEM